VDPSMRTAVVALALVLSGTAALADETDQHGRTHPWKGAGERYTVIDFAAAWCRPCWTVLPKLEAFAAEHPEIRVLVVSVDEKVEGRDALVTKLKLTIPVLWDRDHRIAEHYRPAGMPATYVLDRDGEVVYSHLGSSKKEWDAMVAFLEKAAKR
jgi:cytochrome c biogenesis protein CcmG, thiol:disulfide interchange protein DsbE